MEKKLAKKPHQKHLFCKSWACFSVTGCWHQQISMSCATASYQNPVEIIHITQAQISLTTLTSHLSLSPLRVLEKILRNILNKPP